MIILLFSRAPFYYDLRINSTLCKTYVEEMAERGLRVQQEEATPFEVSTDMGNVSYVVPSFHGAFPIATAPDVSAHNPKFAEYAGTDAAHNAAIISAGGMAMLAVRLLVNDEIYEGARKDFLELQPLAEPCK